MYCYLLTDIDLILHSSHVICFRMTKPDLENGVILYVHTFKDLLLRYASNTATTELNFIYFPCAQNMKNFQELQFCGGNPYMVVSLHTKGLTFNRQ